MIGRAISHYLILEQIGAGGMGVVYRAHDERLDRDVALKVLSPELADDQEFTDRFRREARTLSKLNHPNVATVHDFDTEAGTSFIVMEFIHGTSLLDKIRRGPLSEKELFRLALQLLDGLCAAHAEGIIHRDLKPGNLRETLDGRLKILDFGLARTLNSDLDVTQSIATTSGVVGTLPYMAPEQLRGEYADVRTDIYAIGVVLYELATGSRPFPETFDPRLTDSILHRIPLSAREINPQVSSELDSVVRMALEKEPHRRYGSAREMLNAMERIRGNASADAPGEVRPALRVHVSNRLTEGVGSPATPEKVRTQSGERRGAIFPPQEKAWIAVPYKVFVVVDREFGEKLSELEKGVPVWPARAA
jgi:serine/threonine protein kinase